MLLTQHHKTHPMKARHPAFNQIITSEHHFLLQMCNQHSPLQTSQHLSIINTLKLQTSCLQAWWVVFLLFVFFSFLFLYVLWQKEWIFFRSRALAELLLLHDSLSMLIFAYTSSNIFHLSLMSITFANGKPGIYFCMQFSSCLTDAPPLKVHNLNCLRMCKCYRPCFHTSHCTFDHLSLFSS